MCYLSPFVFWSPGKNASFCVCNYKANLKIARQLFLLYTCLFFIEIILHERKFCPKETITYQGLHSASSQYLLQNQSGLVRGLVLLRNRFHFRSRGSRGLSQATWFEDPERSGLVRGGSQTGFYNSGKGVSPELESLLIANCSKNRRYILLS